MQLEDYIAILQRKHKEVGNVAVAMTQAGYYSDGIFADLYDEPEIKSIELGGQIYWEGGNSFLSPSHKQEFLVLGHSYQSY